MIPVLVYHRVGASVSDVIPTLSERIFCMHLEYLAKHKYKVISFSSMVHAIRSGGRISSGSVVITFDDGCQETATIAAPALRRFGFCATAFITTARLGSSGFMNWDQVCALSREGFSIGSHTAHHTFLPDVGSDHARRELLESRMAIEAHINKPVRWLSYPVGGYTPRVQQLVREVGYEAACTTNRGLEKYRMDLFAIRRIKMTERDSNSLSLRTKFSGYYDLFRSLKPPA